MIKHSYNFTLSKVLGFLIFLVGTFYAFFFKESEVMIFSFSLSAGLMGLKTWSEGLTQRKQIDKNKTDEYSA